MLLYLSHFCALNFGGTINRSRGAVRTSLLKPLLFFLLFKNIINLIYDKFGIAML